MIDETLYTGREQTLVKHFVLDAYLERFCHIIGSWAKTITYIDCFSGPWQSQTTDFSDTSFGIAIKQLRKARSTHAEKGRNLSLRCFFIEALPESYERLRQFAEQIPDIEITTRNLELESAIPEIVRFAKTGGPDAFTFSLIDPLGWRGFAMDVITPLLRLTPGEVLINFMTDFINRFIEVRDEATATDFDRMFGADIRSAVAGLHREEREDRLVAEYMKNLRTRGNFNLVSSAIVFKPEIESTYYHLIYATRHDRGLQVFKEVEKRMQPVMTEARGAAKARKQESRTGQGSLPLMGAAFRSSKQERLRERYLRASRTEVESLLRTHTSIPYDDLWRAALARPLVWESDLKSWISEWQKKDQIQIQGLRERERVPKPWHDHVIVATSNF